MDRQYIDRIGSSPTGQYAMAWGRDTGQTIAAPNMVYDEVTDWLNGPNARKDRVENPTPFKVNGQDTYIVRMGVPVINPRTKEVVGNVTCMVNTGMMQPVLERALASSSDIYANCIYADDGTILDHFIPERIGKKLAEVDMQYGDFIQEANQAVLQGKEYQFGSDLSSNMTETAAAVNQITANVQGVNGRVINQSASVTETNATMEQVVTNINKLNGHVENQSENVSAASSAIEQMVANINSVTKTLVKNAENIKTLKDSSEVGRTGLQEVAGDIQKIARESEGLLEINSVMENIASQTNLLSMNAAKTAKASTL